MKSYVQVPDLEASIWPTPYFQRSAHQTPEALRRVLVKDA